MCRSSANSAGRRCFCLSEQVGPGLQGPASVVQRLAFAAAVAEGVVLHAATAQVHSVAGEADDVEGVHHRDGLRDLFGGGGLEPGEPFHRDDLRRRTPV